METAIEMALERLKEYLSRGVDPNEALMAASSEISNETGARYSDLKSAIAFLQYGYIQ